MEKVKRSEYFSNALYVFVSQDHSYRTSMWSVTKTLGEGGFLARPAGQLPLGRLQNCAAVKQVYNTPRLYVFTHIILQLYSIQFTMSLNAPTCKLPPVQTVQPHLSLQRTQPVSRIGDRL